MNREFLLDALDGVRDDYLAEAAQPPVLRPVRLRRAVVIAVAAMLCVALALPALASNEASYELMYALSPGLAQRLKPVQMSCEDNGIRMEVVAASVEGDTAEAFIALRDLTGDRIDETTDLFDSWSFHTPFDSMGTCRLESYDETTRTALFYVLMSSMYGEDIRPEDGKITFSVREFLSHKQAAEGVDLQSVLDAVDMEPETQNVASRSRGWSGPDDGNWNVPCLVPKEGAGVSPIDGVTVTGAGYVDGKLHIQVYFENIGETDNHGYVYLADEDGNWLELDRAISFWDDEQRGSYEDFIMNVTPGELANYTLYGNFYTSSNLTKGSWQVTFPLETE